MDNKYPFHSNCGCLHSDSDAALRVFTEETVPDLQSNDYYSQTNLHNLSDPDSLKKIIISKESIHALRLNTLQKRILITLNGIQLLLSNGPQPDGVEDLKRRQQRAAEFSSRFCRNYLYQLQRQINNINKMWKSLSNNHSHASYFVLCQKVITAHQNAHSALQAYLHHMPCSVERGIPNKLEEILQVVNDLCSFCSKLGMSEGDSNMKVVKEFCEQLMMQIKSKEAEKREGSSTSLPHSSGQKGGKPATKKEVVPYRLSMYSGSNLEKPPNNQTKKPSKILVGLIKKPSKTQCNKVNVKEANVMTKLKQNSALVKSSTYSSYGSSAKEEKQFGVVSSADNVRTMMESFLAEEPAVSSDIISTATTIPNIIPELTFFKQPEEKSLHSYKKTLRKLETEINNLKEQTQSLKESGHPNYPFYINMLETMFHQLNNMKSPKNNEDLTPSENVNDCETILDTKEGETLSSKFEEQNVHIALGDDERVIELPKRRRVAEKMCNQEYPKNVKLVCLMSSEDKIVSEEHVYVERQQVVTPCSVPEAANPDNMEMPHRSVKNSENKSLIVIKNSREDLATDNSRKLEGGLLEELPTIRVDIQGDVQSDYGLEKRKFDSIQNNMAFCKDFTVDMPEKKESGLLQLTISDEDKKSAYAYHQDFHKYISGQSLYEESIKPWLMISRIANNLIDSILEDVVIHDTGIQKITSGLFQLEFQ